MFRRSTWLTSSVLDMCNCTASASSAATTSGAMRICGGRRVVMAFPFFQGLIGVPDVSIMGPYVPFVKIAVFS